MLVKTLILFFPEFKIENEYFDEYQYILTLSKNLFFSPIYPSDVNFKTPFDSFYYDNINGIIIHSIQIISN